MPERTVSITTPGIDNPYGTYTALYGSPRTNKVPAKKTKKNPIKGKTKKKTTKRKGY